MIRFSIGTKYFDFDAVEISTINPIIKQRNGFAPAYASGHTQEVPWKLGTEDGEVRLHFFHYDTEETFFNFIEKIKNEIIKQKYTDFQILTTPRSWTISMTNHTNEKNLFVVIPRSVSSLFKPGRATLVIRGYIYSPEEIEIDV